MAGHLWDGALDDRVFSPCRRCGRPLSSHKANQMSPVLVLDDDVTPTVVVVQNDLLRYLFTDDARSRCSDSAPGRDVAS